tara:strand:+ start:1759 stop:2184 length:426 start_codon:yes stop_codon:yes gene_type:complete
MEPIGINMKLKNLDKIAKIEKAMAKKYGHEAIANPKSFWTEEKEKEYLEEVKEFYKEEYKRGEQKEKVEKDGFFIPKNLITKEIKRKCSSCETLSFKLKDDLYMNKFDCCFTCYLKYVQFNEEKWLNGWRPTNENENNKKE